MPPSPMAEQYPIDGSVEHLRIFLRQPGRRGGGGRTENHLHSLLPGQIQEPVKEFPGKNSLIRLRLAPGKFGDPDYPDAALQHPLQILFPQALRPVFRVITGPQYHFLSIYNLSHTFSSTFFLYFRHYPESSNTCTYILLLVWPARQFVRPQILLQKNHRSLVIRKTKNIKSPLSFLRET